MEELLSRVIKINEILDSVTVGYGNIKRCPVGIYKDGKIYTNLGVYELNEIENINEYSIVNAEAIYQDDVINAGLFIKNMTENHFYRCKDARLPNDLLALDYPNVYLNYDYLSYERKLLLKGISTNDRYLKMSFFRMFLNVRDLRKQMIGKEFSMLEYQLETIEGLSQYIMYRFLVGYDKKYHKFIKSIIKDSLTEINSLFSFRYRNIYSGIMILLMFEDLGVNIEELYESNDTLYQYVVKHLNFIKEPIPLKSDKALLSKLNEYNENVSEKFAIYFENDPKKVNGSWQIYQYDPLRIYKDKNNIYHESFVVLKSLLDNKLIYLEGPIITRVMENSIDIVNCYYKLAR